MKNDFFVLVFLISMMACGKKTVPPCDVDGIDINYPFIAHSHNDYEQENPIFNALKHGFVSLEADVVFDGEELRVSHDDDNLSSKPQFEQSYLSPILGESTLGESGLILLVDIKEYSEELIANLNSVLAKYDDRIVSREAPNDVANKVKVILSGDIPRQEIIEEQSNKYLFIDGRYNDQDLNASSELVPLISMDITDISNSNIKNKEIVRSAVNQVHDKGKMIRFWKTNDSESVWLKLIDLNVDIIGVDDIEHFCGVMQKNDFIK